MKWFDLVFLSVIGLLFVVVGWLIWKKQKIRLIHSYHYPNVKEEDKKPYTAAMEKAVMLIGIGSFLAGVVNFAFSTNAGWLLFLICFTLGFGRIIIAQKKYNGGLF